MSNIYQIFPQEILIDILSRLSVNDLINFCSTSTYGNTICNDDVLWKQIYIQKFGNQLVWDQYTWHINYLIRNFFTPNQYRVIMKLRQISPSDFNFLLNLRYHDSYLNTYSNQGVYILDNILVYIFKPDIPIEGVDYITGIYAYNGPKSKFIYKLVQYPNTNNIITLNKLRIPNQNIFKDLWNQGWYLGSAQLLPSILPELIYRYGTLESTILDSDQIYFLNEYINIL